MHPRRLATLMSAAIERCQLDLTGSVVLTEAASGAYVVTPILAAMAKADRVYALTRSMVHGTVEEITAQTQELADFVGVADKIEVITHKSEEVVSRADIITNSGHVRPIDAQMIGWMRPNAVIPLMYEAWEFRPTDLDLSACRRKSILVAGTNERHPAVDVFSFLGMMAIKLLMDAGVAVYASSILLLCDNPFCQFIERSLVNDGANVDVCENLSTAARNESYDAILVALQPRTDPVISAFDATLISDHWPGAVIAQFWGDIDRSALLEVGVPVWPPDQPAPGHMGILPSAIGPESIIRLQTGGLKVGEVLWKGRINDADADRVIASVVQSGWAQELKMV